MFWFVKQAIWITKIAIQDNVFINEVYELGSSKIESLNQSPNPPHECRPNQSR